MNNSLKLLFVINLLLFSVCKADEIRCYYCNDCDEVSEDQLQTCSLDNVISFTTTTTITTTTGEPITVTATEEATPSESPTPSPDITTSSTEGSTPSTETTTETTTTTPEYDTQSTSDTTTSSAESNTDTTTSTPADTTTASTEATTTTNAPPVPNLENDPSIVESDSETVNLENIPSINNPRFNPYSNFPSVHRLRRSIRNDVNFVCVTVKTEEDGEEVTSRGCAVAGETDEQTCENLGTTLECEVCNTDSCNSATGLQLSFAALLATVVIFYFR